MGIVGDLQLSGWRKRCTLSGRGQADPVWLCGCGAQVTSPGAPEGHGSLPGIPVGYQGGRGDGNNVKKNLKEGVWLPYAGSDPQNISNTH